MSRPRKSRPQAPAPAAALVAPETVTVPAGAFKNSCLALMDDVHDGSKQVVITKHGNAVAMLVAPGGEAPSAFGWLRGTVTAHGDIVSPDPEAWGDLG